MDGGSNPPSSTEKDTEKVSFLVLKFTLVCKYKYY